MLYSAMPPIQLDLRAVLLGSAAERGARAMLMVDLPVAVRTLQDFKSLLRSKEWGEWLVPEPLVFLKGTMQIVDTACLICVFVQIIFIE